MSMNFSDVVALAEISVGFSEKVLTSIGSIYPGFVDSWGNHRLKTSVEDEEEEEQERRRQRYKMAACLDRT